MTVSSAIVLLVEDDPNDVLLMQRAFQKARLSRSIVAVDDGEQAIAYLSGAGEYSNRKRHPLPHLMLLDLKLPLKSGMEVLEWVRQQQPPLRRLPIVVFSSSRQAVDINRAYTAGANSYMVKPGEFDELLEVVKTLELYWFVLNERPQVQEER